MKSLGPMACLVTSLVLATPDGPLAARPGDAAPDAGALRAGAARVDVTPGRPVPLSGYASREGLHEGIESPLEARALVLEDAAKVLTVIVSVDAIGLPIGVRERVLGAIRHRTGIYRVRVAMGCTHSHYAPALTDNLANMRDYSPEELDSIQAYTRQLTQGIVRAIDEAIGALAPATLQYGKGSVGFAANRRTAGGPVDHELPVLAAMGANGSPIAVLFNYACHATTMVASLNRVCGDWPGFAAEELRAAYPGAVILPLIGCGADANPHPRGELAMARAYGHDLAQEVRRVLSGPLDPLPGTVDAQFEFVPLRFARIPGREELAQQAANGAPHEQRFARRLLERLDREGSLSPTHPYPVQVLTFGARDLVMVFLGGEVVVDYVLRLREELPVKRLWVTAYANDTPAYIASRRVLDEGGYEADSSMLWYGQPSRWDASVEDAIVQKVRSFVLEGAADAVARFKPPPPLEPEAALASFRLPAGLAIELAAAEPEVTDPVAIAFDEVGRLYAAEMRDYPLGPPPGKPHDGRLRVLEDSDGDGRFERSRIFAEDLPYANGVACFDGGVLVTSIPSILLLKDTDGDGKADVRKTLYTGFRPGNSQHIVNTLEWGPDGWIYVNGGDGALLRCPEEADMAPLALAYTNLRFDPSTLRVEAVTGYRGGFGITFDERGARFTCDNQTPIAHIVLERQDLERNPDLRIDDVDHAIADQGLRVYAASRTLERFNDPQDYGRFSSACGVHVYIGDALPEEYRGSYLTCEPVSNLVHRDVLLPRGATYTARRGEPEGLELLASTDHWFRPVSCATGPDGALYVVDMYREVIEHPEWIPAHMQRALDLKGGMDRGRIYRLRAAGQVPARVTFADRSPGRLLEALDSPNGWARRTAQRLIFAASSGVEAEGLRGFLRKGALAHGRLLALHALEARGEAALDDVLVALKDRGPGVRAAGARAASARLQADAAPGERAVLEAALALLEHDPDGAVRLQAALAPASSARTRLALQDAADPWVGTALLVGASAPLSIARALLSAGLEAEGRPALLARTLAVIGARRRSAEVLGALELLLRAGDGAPEEASPAAPKPEDPHLDARRLAGLSVLLEAVGRLALPALLEEGGSRGERLGERLEALARKLAGRAQDPGVDLGERTAALQIVAASGAPDVAGILESFLDARQPFDIQATAARLLAQSSAPGALDQLVDALPRLSPICRVDAFDALLGAPGGALTLVAASEGGRFAPGELLPQQRRAILERLPAEQRVRGEKALAVALTPRVEVVERYWGALSDPNVARSADPAAGKAHFQRLCTPCHRMGDVGNVVGADLSGMKARTVDALVADILDPNRAVAPEFLNYVASLEDGRVLSGILATESPYSIVLRRAEGKTDSILRRDIIELRSTGLSLMPEGFEKELSPGALSDLIAFIRS